MSASSNQMKLEALNNYLRVQNPKVRVFSDLTNLKRPADNYENYQSSGTEKFNALGETRTGGMPKSNDRGALRQSAELSQV